MRRTMVVVVLWCLATSAHAQMVYKCVGKGGAVSFQSEPCAANQRTAKTVYAPPEAERSRPVYQPSQAAQPASNYGQVVYNSPSPSPSQAEDRRSHCNAAKQNREARIREVGLNRTYDFLRRLDEMVYEACKGL